MIEGLDGNRSSCSTLFIDSESLWLGDITFGRMWVLTHGIKSGEEGEAILSLIVQSPTTPRHL